MGAFSLLGLVIAFIIGLAIENKVQPDQDGASEAQNIARRELSVLHTNAFIVILWGIYRFSLTNGFKSEEVSFSGQGIFITVVRIKRKSSNNDGSGINALRGWNISYIDRFDVPIHGGNLIIAKFIGALQLDQLL